MAYTKYSLTPANNTATPPDGAPEGMLPSAVNDTMRDMMAQIRDCGDGIRDGTYTMTAAKITGGTITGVTFTGNTFSNPTITGVSTFAAGTVSAPAITTSGDTNTGIFFPAADTIAFTEGGVESMRIDSAGQVGVGVTPNTWSTGKVVEVGASGTSLWGLSSGTSYVTAGYYFNSTDKFALTGNYALFSQLVPADGSFRWHSSTATGTAGNNATMSERMRITSGGNLGIGTSTPDIYSTSFARQFTVSTTTASGYSVGTFAGGSGGAGGVEFGNQTIRHSGIYSLDGSALALYTNATNSGTSLTERMRITSGGEVYIAGTTDQGAYNLQVNGTGVWGAGAYVNGSDERIKDNIAPLDSGLDVVSKLNPVTYKYKKDWSKDQSTQTGFIAQELLTALEGKNYVDGVVQQGGEYMSVAYQNIIPILVKAIQEQQAMIEELKTKVTTLENK